MQSLLASSPSGKFLRRVLREWAKEESEEVKQRGNGVKFKL
jgi:acyl-CoA synthetase (AMP-forming)/AMP-acid ligase II